jgi:aminopeptidase C
LAEKELVKVIEEERKVVLPRWDPMGSLAIHSRCHDR